MDHCGLKRANCNLQLRIIRLAGGYSLHPKSWGGKNTDDNIVAMLTGKHNKFKAESNADREKEDLQCGTEKCI